MAESSAPHGACTRKPDSRAKKPDGHALIDPLFVFEPRPIRLRRLLTLKEYTILSRSWLVSIQLCVHDLRHFCAGPRESLPMTGKCSDTRGRRRRGVMPIWHGTPSRKPRAVLPAASARTFCATGRGAWHCEGVHRDQFRQPGEADCRRSVGTVQQPTASLPNVHDPLDAVVTAAYGRCSEISNGDVLRELPALDGGRA